MQSSIVLRFYVQLKAKTALSFINLRKITSVNICQVIKSNIFVKQQFASVLKGKQKIFIRYQILRMETSMKGLTFSKLRNINFQTVHDEILISQTHQIQNDSLLQNNKFMKRKKQPENICSKTIFKSYCYIHCDISAFYKLIRIGTESLNLCKKCATKFASLGHEVQRLQIDEINEEEKSKIIRNCMRKIEFDLVKTKLKAVQNKYNKKRQILTNMIQKHALFLSQYQNFYGNIKDKLVFLEKKIKSKYQSLIQENLSWRERTDLSIINIEKFIGELSNKIKTLEHVDDSEQVFNSFYRNMLVFYQYQCKEVAEQFSDERQNEQTNIINELYQKLSNPVEIFQSLTHRMKNKVIQS